MSGYGTFGATRILGNTTYHVIGCSSSDEAIERIMEQAYQDGNWRPRDLRTKWWQFWRPTEHTELEARFASRQPEDGR